MSDAGGESSPVGSTGERWNRRPVADRRAWLTVARKDVADASRSWQLYVLGAVFATAMAISGLQPVLTAMALNIENPGYTAQTGLARMAGSIAFIVPLAVLLFGHMTIAGERERGSLRTLLAFPVSRRDVVVGTLLGRTAVVGTTLAVGLAFALVLMWATYDDIGLLGYAGFSVGTVAFGAIFVAMAVGISAASRTRGSALAWAMSAFGVTTVLWNIMLVLVRALTDVSIVTYNFEPDRAPGWYVFLERAHPGTAFRHVLSNWIVPVFSGSGMGESSQRPGLTTHGPEPFYLDEWVLVLVLLAWGIVPLAIGYWRFRDAEVI